MHRFKLDKFEGPLDLLLQLIEKQELSITDVSLAAVTEQYLNYLEAHQDLSPEDLADFLVVAAKLLLLKSRVLLPDLFLTDEEDAELGLAEQLAIYKLYVEASLKLARRLRTRHFSYARERLPVAETATFSPPPSLTSEAMRHVFIKVLENLKEFVRPIPELIARTISLQEKIIALRKLLETGSEIDFHRFMQNAQSRMEIIINFLAILELIKQRYVIARQESHGASIVLTRLEPN
ncbi:hypothetical protein A2936_02285 [Candidatus Uhrbacteria bacterium RIFCSPLOWO2_01_FULL_47_25]|uniref:Segregation and condensation protein A n=1 Tax=Candidatus Uhrbacteria bacterium RIFCSPLOWO2_01_FULL_47_25 TaxID=1802402 RepID=A0A1F7UWD8_9BACT|nr:MAG: hypothetical protein A2936_02285 [Candidatus Uhrbacteria bacterium RIFCSPLOWO2_01_FULL_47_25]